MKTLRNQATHTTAICAYSLDNQHWTTLRGEFKLAFDWCTGTFQGEHFAIFCYNPQPGEGFVDVDWFKFSDNANEDKPASHP